MTIADRINQHMAERTKLKASEAELAAAMVANFQPYEAKINQTMGGGLKILTYRAEFFDGDNKPMMLITRLSRHGEPLSPDEFLAEMGAQAATREQYLTKLGAKLGYEIDFFLKRLMD